MIPTNYFCDGQMSIFDILVAEDVPKDIEVSKDADFKTLIKDCKIPLKRGQTVYKVIKGILYPYVFNGNHWTCEKNGIIEPFYQLTDGQIYDVCQGSKLGIDYFTDLDEAKAKADKYCEEHKDDILQIHYDDLVKTVAWSYVRKCDGCKMVAFISELKNGLVYMKDFYTYYHAKDKKFDKVVKELTNSFNFKNTENIVEETDYIPECKTLFACNSGDDWLYADAEYAGCRKYD